MLNEKWFGLENAEKEFLESTSLYEEEQKRQQLNRVVEEFAQDLENIYSDMLEYSFSNEDAEELIEMYRKLQGIIERNHLDRSPLLLFSDLLLLQNRLEEAKVLNEHLLEYYREEGNPIFYATACNRLSSVFVKMDNFPKAEKWAKESLRVFRKLSTKFSDSFETSVANACFGLGQLYLEMGIVEKFDMAESLLKEALEVYKKIKQQDYKLYSEAIAEIYDCLAVKYGNEGKYEEAEVMFKVILEIYKELNEESPGMYTSNLLSNCYNLTKLNEEKCGNFDLKDLNEKALQLYKKLGVKE